MAAKKEEPHPTSRHLTFRIEPSVPSLKSKIHLDFITDVCEGRGTTVQASFASLPAISSSMPSRRSGQYFYGSVMAEHKSGEGSVVVGGFGAHGGGRGGDDGGGGDVSCDRSAVT
jgi:hypothetical protein